MSDLVLPHGTAPRWWLSESVWPVPTTSPSEAFPGVVHPSVVDEYYVSAIVQNTADVQHDSAGVYFWWANPSLGITTSSAHPIGIAGPFIDPPDTTSKFKIVTETMAAWSPMFVNHGHECLIAWVTDTYETASPPTPPLVLNGDTDPQVAQRNLGIVETGMRKAGRFHYAFEVWNTAQEERSFVIAAHQAPLSDIEPFLKGLPGNLTVNEKPGKVEKLGFVASACPDPSEYHTAKPVLDQVKLAPFKGTGFSLVGSLEAGAALIHVTQTFDDQIVGGLSVLILYDRG